MYLVHTISWVKGGIIKHKILRKKCTSVGFNSDIIQGVKLEPVTLRNTGQVGGIYQGSGERGVMDLCWEGPRFYSCT
jgi:hypothetical protein